MKTAMVDILGGKRPLPKLKGCLGREDLKLDRKIILTQIGVFNSNEVRRHKLSLDKCIYLELCETGYIKSAQLFENIINMNDDIFRDNLLGNAVDLKLCDTYMLVIKDGLMKAEIEERRGELVEQAKLLVQIALVTAKDMRKGLIWLTDHLFLLAIDVASKTMTDDGRMYACCRYMYGRFTKNRNPSVSADKVMDILDTTRVASRGKNWLLDSFMIENEPHFDFYQNISERLYELILEETKLYRTIDPFKSERLMLIAERRALDTGKTELHASALIEMGMSNLATDNLKYAYKNFTRALEVNKSISNYDGMCQSLLYRAIVHQRSGYEPKAVEDLTQMGLLSVKNASRYYLGLAVHHIGEIYLNQGNAHHASMYLGEAVACFSGQLNLSSLAESFSDADDLTPIVIPSTNEICETDNILLMSLNEIQYGRELETSRIMHAIAYGQTLVERYFVILKRSNYCATATKKLMDYNSNQRPWWTDMNDDQSVPCNCKHCNRTLVDIIKKKMIEDEQKREAIAQSIALGLDDYNKDEYMDITKMVSGSKPYYYSPGVSVMY